MRSCRTALVTVAVLAAACSAPAGAPDGEVSEPPAPATQPATPEPGESETPAPARTLQPLESQAVSDAPAWVAATLPLADEGRREGRDTPAECPFELQPVEGGAVAYNPAGSYRMVDADQARVVCTFSGAGTSVTLTVAVEHGHVAGPLIHLAGSIDTADVDGEEVTTSLLDVGGDREVAARSAGRYGQHRVEVAVSVRGQDVTTTTAVDLLVAHGLA